METRKIDIKKIFLFVFIITIFISCAEGDNKMQRIEYGTPEFSEFVKNASISLDESWRLQLDFAKKNYSENDYRMHKKYAALIFIVDDHYVYTMEHSLSKMLKGYLLKGIWVNTNTGKVFKNDKSPYIKALSYGWGKPEES